MRRCLTGTSLPYRRQHVWPGFSTETMMSDRLPQEITDSIIDLLHDEPRTLRLCCLVSRSWIHRTRKYLFGTVKFNSSTDLETWKNTFLNPFNTPGYHTLCLQLGCSKVAAAVLEECGWIRAFPNVVRLEIWSYYTTLSPSQVFNLIRYLPFLEDLEVTSFRVLDDDDNDDAAVFQPSTSPPLTGTLELCWVWADNGSGGGLC
ncbi:hypothetical protein BJ322DRAFT_528892 [Thelephora terrestris]|uniref:F-box domain-containing protein n=1 Tax=Thelephora terrestris TaxID=56493 RepID=A0A9P6HL22_9AGAM|nr:hypothetical protein BJ322DRAFT_528892 [Thelephora terrestris]